MPFLNRRFLLSVLGIVTLLFFILNPFGNLGSPSVTTGSATVTCSGYDCPTPTPSPSPDRVSANGEVCEVVEKAETEDSHNPFDFTFMTTIQLKGREEKLYDLDRRAEFYTPGREYFFMVVNRTGLMKVIHVREGCAPTVPNPAKG